jgi:dCTP deaminase
LTSQAKAASTDQPFVIPPGQFAFLQTEEVVSVPVDAMAFISMKATFKMKGLVNVSGFHVDPGWKGPLLFAVYNAGPQTVHLQRGLRLFLIWIADLDLPSDRHKTTALDRGIPPTFITNLTGGQDTFFELDKRFKEEVKRLEKESRDLEKRVEDVARAHVRLLVTCSGLIGILIMLIGYAVNPVIAGLGKTRLGAVEASAPASSASGEGMTDR